MTQNTTKQVPKWGEDTSEAKYEELGKNPEKK
jgi:hypothetical protein